MFIINFILDCGASVMLPIIIFILGIIMGAGVSKSFKSGITIGIGFTGISLVTGLLSDELGPVAQQMTERLGLHMDIIDIGWPAMSSITWAWSAAGLMIPICLGVNILMLALKLTKTMNVDVWNYWQFAFIGAAVMYLMPKMVACLMEGLMPISQAAQELMGKKFAGREVFIGLDAAVSLGEPAVIAVGLVLVPITIALAIILPGNRILPFADLAVIPYIVCLFTAMCKGNIFRALIVGTVVMGLVLLMASTLAGLETPLAISAGVTIPKGATLIGNLDRANIITWLFIKLSTIFG